VLDTSEIVRPGRQDFVTWRDDLVGFRSTVWHAAICKRPSQDDTHNLAADAQRLIGKSSDLSCQRLVLVGEMVCRTHSNIDHALVR
jgi:hypothetical protein